MHNSSSLRFSDPSVSIPGGTREERYRSILENYEAFNGLLANARRCFRHGRYNAAALYAEVAAYSATWKHAGFFANLPLEDLLLNIGRTAVDEVPSTRVDPSCASPPKRILHVATWVEGLQGLNRFMTRWIENDVSRSHCLVITGHGNDKIPERLREAVQKSQGSIFILDETEGSILQRAARLRRLSASFDLIALHLQTEDVMPLIAFAKRQCPIIFMNNADHNYWLGVSISDLVVNLRESGKQLSHERRGIIAERNVILPILIDRRDRTRDRAEAKRMLDLDPDTVLLLSIARAPKYRSMNGVCYAETHVPVLTKHKNAVLWVVGPMEDDDWRRAKEITGGRVKAFGPRSDTGLFYEAADLYVDSFPVVSITSLLEAGSYCLPLVSRYPYSDACGVLGADTPALDKCVLRAKSVDEYQLILSRLIEDKGERDSLGELAGAAIQEIHYPENWLALLERVYSVACGCSGLEPNRPPELHYPSELDENIEKVYRMETSLQEYLFRRFLRKLPADERLRLWMHLVVSFPYLASPEALTNLLDKLGMKDSLRRLFRSMEKKMAKRNSAIRKDP